MNLATALKNDRLCKSLTGLSVEEFTRLVPDFKWNYKESRIAAKANRTRKYGGGRTGNLVTIEHKLFFILLYLKMYPTFDVLGWITGFEKTRANRWVGILLPILEQTLERKMVLPERKITTVEELVRKFPGIKDILIDGTERRVQRPKNKKKQKETKQTLFREKESSYEKKI